MTIAKTDLFVELSTKRGFQYERVRLCKGIKHRPEREQAITCVTGIGHTTKQHFYRQAIRERL